jgi:superfamily I DNA and/or RNA helicase
MRALGLLRPDPKQAPSLAVLSPYREQVKALQQELERRRLTSLSHLSGFRPAVGDESFCGTVDSFQGDQADLVFISLVRNNGHAIPAKALGFLRDDRRMNVLLSRAKWRMIIVGSLTFYENIVDLAKALPDSDIGFLQRFLASLAKAKKAGDASVVPWTALARVRE